MIQSVGMMLRYSLAQPRLSDAVEAAVAKVLQDGLRTADIYTEQHTRVGTVAMGDAVVAALRSAA
jgi:3-isopropylmalate dehydrogenase